MKFKRCISAILVGMMLLQATGCKNFWKEAVNSNLGTTIDKGDFDSGEDIHIRDKDVLYKNQDNTEIVTMYLTVSTGNSAENTNHTWEEINTYSPHGLLF